MNVNSKAGSYDVVVNASAPSGVKSVRVPIWTNAKDIKWYQAKKQKDGTWTVHMDIRNHNYSKGSYTTHVYMTSNDGHETAISLNKKVEFDLPVDGFVFLDPGHGGYDSGAVSSSGTKEKDITLSVSNLVKNKLSAAGYQVIMSRYDDRYIDFVTERSRMSNLANADIFVSIHVNSGGGGVVQGVEVYWYEYDSAFPPQINQAYHNDPIRLRNSERLANSIQSNIIKQTSAINRGVRRQTYAVVREAKAPAVLVETGYIDNRSEELRLKSARYQEKLAQGIVDGIK
ncbi:N-acetylmuramoyl-L-alanine amidase [Enterococcus cecorum]|uniref:N-acetylmuramoyl-L-alanine amidase n=1 Tax=Enterococcus cecorum TaxID=44008 RepID=UPI001F183CB1|nr:N-acetylmuramoyl-L-alanine amidase [Enterococcus cecorum]